MSVARAGVWGAGAIAVQIAHAIASAGIPVALRAPDAEAAELARERVRELAQARLRALVERVGEAEAARELERTLALIGVSHSDAGLGDVDIAIEAVADELESKRDALQALDAATGGRAVLASTTASLHLAELAEWTTRPERVVGLHFAGPPADARAVEVVEALASAPDALAAAAAFVAELRRSAIRCLDSPGFVVNRVLLAAAGELWLAQEEGGLSAAAIDAAVVEAGAAALGPFALADRLGLERVRAVASRLREAFGERFHVHARMAELAAAGAAMRDLAGSREPADAAALVERFRLRALAESCLVLEEQVAGARDIDLALRAAGGLEPPFAAADAGGLEQARARLERAAAEWGERFAAPVILRRLCAQGRLGAAAGQGFFPAPRPAAGEEGEIKLERRGEVAIAWIDSPPANSITLAMIERLESLWRRISNPDGAPVRALVFASANPALFCAGADIKAFHAMDAAGARELIERMHALMLELARSPIVTIAAVGGLAYGGGCELAMAADVRIAARSASFAQPEIRLGIIPGFGGTQRLPRLIGAGRALERNLTGEPIEAAEAWELGLVSALVADHELLDEALAWARRLAAQPPLAIAEIKRLAADGELERRLAAEQEAFARVFATADAREGIAAFVEKRRPRFRGA